MKRNLISLIVVTLSWGADKTADVERQLKAAINTELVDGNLKSAIEQYKKVAQSGVRSLAAQALLHLAEAYEKQGEGEARKTYERIVKEYGDQADAAGRASRRLATLGGTTPREGIRLSQFFKPDKSGLTLLSVSPDGRWAAATDYASQISVVDLASGASRGVADYDARNSERSFVDEAAISRDGKQIAFWHYFNGATRMDLRVVNVDTKAERTVYRSKGTNSEEEWGMPTDWSPDGTQIVMQVESRFGKTLQEGLTEFVLVPAAGGSPRVIKTAEYTRRYRPRILFSPDGKYVAYDFPARKELAQGDIFVLPVNGGPEVAIAPSTAQDTIVGWTPDGSSLLFLSERTPGTGLYRVPVRDGKQAGEPELIRRDMGNVLPLALTRNGTFLHVQQPSLMNAYTVSLDFSNGRVLAPFKRINESFVDSISSPSWSGDGGMVAMLKWPGPKPSILIRPDGPGAERELAPDLQIAGAPLIWAADGRSIMAVGTKDDKSGLYRIDATTGAAKLVQEGVIAEASSDGRYVWRATRPSAIVRIDTATKEEKTIFSGPPEDTLRGLRLSPDGRRLAFIQGSRRLKVVSSDGGNATELAAPANAGVPFPPAWTADGRNLLVPHGRDGRAEFWIVPTDGSPARKTDIGAVDRPGVISVHPDGKRIGYSTRSVKYEYWALENFLPSSK